MAWLAIAKPISGRIGITDLGKLVDFAAWLYYIKKITVRGQLADGSCC
ncbi:MULTISPECIES: hypothetical protein [Paenibacillus]|nr:MULTISPECIES: hypothetical protein [Paenibacillus]